MPDKEILGINLSAKATDRAKTLGFTVHKTVDLRSFGLGVTKLVPPPDLSANEAQRLLEKELPAESFSANRTYHIYRSATGRELDPADRQSSSASRLERGTHCPSERCFGPQLIRWTPKTAECARGVRIGVIDTGIDRMHPAFADSRVTVNRFVNISDKQAPSWHGTGVLALLAGSRLSGTPGLVPHAQFYVADVFFADSLGRPVSDTVGLLQALDWMRRSNVHIVNLSVAGPSDPALEKAIVKLSGDGIIFVAAAGNDGPTAPPAYPAAYKQVIAVTAVNRSLQAYRHANRGDYIDVAAPGVGIWTALPQERGAFHSGTSFASPYVTAIIASLTSKTLRDKASVMRALTIQDLGPPGPDPIYGRGLVLAPSDCAPIKPWVPTVSAKKEPKVAGN